MTGLFSSFYTARVAGKTTIRFSILAALLLSLFGFTSCEKDNPAAKGRVVVRYWERWTGFEADAMRKIVGDFNASQDRIYVDYSSVSQMDRKLMLSISGGVPPDVAGVWGRTIPVYAENNALLPLDKYAASSGITHDNYIDVFWKICSYRDHLWALPTTPACLALIWNKKLFREAGLDPEQPPRSIAELEQFNEKLIKRRPDGRLQSCGYLPAEPGWWNETRGWWFGGSFGMGPIASPRTHRRVWPPTAGSSLTRNVLGRVIRSDFAMGLGTLLRRRIRSLPDASRWCCKDLGSIPSLRTSGRLTSNGA